MEKLVEEEFVLGRDGFSFGDLHDPLRLRDLHDDFWRFVAERDSQLAGRFASLSDASTSRPRQSEILIDVAGHLGGYLARLFRIVPDADRLAEETARLETIFQFKQDFLKARIFKRFGEPVLDDAAFRQLDEQVQRIVDSTPPHVDPEVRFSQAVVALLACEKEPTSETSPLRELGERLCTELPGDDLTEQAKRGLQLLGDWCVQVHADPQRAHLVDGWVAFERPETLKFNELVQISRPDSDLPEMLEGPEAHRRLRDGFKLTDQRMNRKEYLREIDYCIICHPREKDTCSHGFLAADGKWKPNPLGIPLTGCPLEERISEMHALRKRGAAIAALAMIMLDNPMCPGTGHRICNDCMKGCIFQKQTPVNIPQAETGVVSDVLNLPFGFEIYNLLTRFNPLNGKRPFALPYNGVDILVVGLGPAGYTLAHFLANEGFGVVGIDGLKLEPMPAELTGEGRDHPAAVRDVSVLQQELDQRILSGFGGVSEYGITVRWDKTFLAVMYLTLLRRGNFRCYGGIRFGGTLTLEDAWQLGFQHVALATGAGKPTIVGMKNQAIRGIRTASDFLMALQLTGAFKKTSLASLQVQLPAIVIGGGLTAIDTATELLAYYPVQVERTLEQFEKISSRIGEETFWKQCDPEETAILTTFLEHGRAVRKERKLATRDNRPPDFVSLCRQWGGVSIAYRRKVIDSPAYRLNHEEVEKALEEGIRFIENLSPTEAVPDEFGAVAAVKFRRPDGSELTLPAKSVCMAAGTTPNTVYGREYPGTFSIDADGKFFQKHRLVANGDGVKLELVTEPSREAFFLSYEHDGKFVSFYGDNHPDYAGNVVKAMASAKHGAPHVSKLFAEQIAAGEQNPTPLSKFQDLTRFLDEALIPRVVEVKRLTPTIVEVIVKARFAARKFLPGQFYRLQNYETLAPISNGVRLTLEGIALTGAWVDPENDLLSMIVLEMGVSSRLCAALKPGEPVVVMGPTGTPSETPSGETVLLVGGGLGNAVLFSIGRAFRNNGSKVLYFAGYRRKLDLFHQGSIEEATDEVIWAVDHGDPIIPRRPQDRSFVGNIVQAMLAYAKDEIPGPLPSPEVGVPPLGGNVGVPPLGGKTPAKAGTPALDPSPTKGEGSRNGHIPLGDVDRIIAIGSDRMMAAVAEARHGVLQQYLKPGAIGIASINSMMQCMMKEVCGQCLQQHVAPQTKQPAEVVFTCFNQDQCMDRVDFANLRHRLKINSLSEKLANRFLDVLTAG